MVIHGLMGLGIALIVPKNYLRSYFNTGIIIGLILWGVMNLLFVFVFTRLTEPSWALGIGSILTDLITHVVLGVIIAYALWLSTTEVNSNL